MIKVNNSLNIDLVMATWLASNTYTGSKPGKSISATTLLRSTQQQVLGLRAVNSPDIIEEVDISTLLKSSIGTALHKSIQDTWESTEARISGLKNLGITEKMIDKIAINPEKPDPTKYNLFFEKRVDKQFHGWNITGQFDLVSNGDLHDFKSTSTYTYINKTKEKDYILQGSIYRWLNPELIKGDFITIHYIFTDWNKNYLNSKDNYPLHPFVSIKLPLMSIAETESFLSEKLRLIDENMEATDLPPCDNKTLLIEEVWQYFANETSTKASKNFTSPLEASQYLATKGKGIVKKKAGEPKGCSWCNCRGICKQYANFLKIGLIKE